MAAMVEQLLEHPEPAIVWKTRTAVLGEPSDPELQEQVKRSPRVRQMLASIPATNVYNKWHGSHWVLATLADVGYPPGDQELSTHRDNILDTWLRPSYFTEFEATSTKAAYGGSGVPVMNGRYRRCASQQGNALWFLHRLGLADERCDRLAERLLHWQWPDGGWNCDKKPEADTSSFMETLTPMRGLAAHAAATKDEDSTLRAHRAAEVFLARNLFRRRRDGEVIDREFVALHYPLYWHYDYLHGLKALSEIDLLVDPRCSDALDLLEEKRLPDGGWPAEKRYYTVSDEPKAGSEAVDWGGTSKTKSNPWVTVDALGVLVKAGRLSL
jgi:hypothetical protein